MKWGSSVKGARPIHLGALPSHLGHADQLAAPVAVVEGHHRVTADAHTHEVLRVGAGRDVVRAAGAEVGRPLRQRGARGGVLGRGLEHVDARPCRGRERCVVDHAPDRPRDAIGGHGRLRLEHRPALRVLGTEHKRRVRGAVEGVLYLGLEKRQLVLGHQHGVHPGGQAPDLVTVKRPRHADAHHAQAEGVTCVLAQPQILEGAQHGLMGDAGCHDRNRRPARLGGHAVEPGSHAVLARSLQPRRHQIALGDQVGRGQQNWRLEPTAGGQVGHARQPGAHLHRGACVGDVSHDLQPGPQARVPRHRHRVQAQHQQLLHGAGREQRHHEAATHRLARAWHRRGLAGGVVADQGQSAPTGRRATQVAVADGVGGAVEAGALAVPEARDAVPGGPRKLAEQLGAGNRGGRELLVYPRLEDDPGGIEKRARARQLLVESSERRALIAADEDAGVQAARDVERALVQQHPHERLDARHQRCAGVRGVAVRERRVRPGQRRAHFDTPVRASASNCAARCSAIASGVRCSLAASARS